MPDRKHPIGRRLHSVLEGVWSSTGPKMNSSRAREQLEPYSYFPEIEDPAWFEGLLKQVLRVEPGACRIGKIHAAVWRASVGVSMI